MVVGDVVIGSRAPVEKGARIGERRPQRGGRGDKGEDEIKVGTRVRATRVKRNEKEKEKKKRNRSDVEEFGENDEKVL